MKTKIVFTILLGLSALSFVFNKTILINNAEEAGVHPTPVNQDTTFIIGALDDGFDFGLNRLDELGFNVWHKYIGWEKIGNRRFPIGWTINGAPNDKLFSDSNVYVPEVQGILSRLDSHQLRSFVQRPKIEWLCYGQRSDYQCEPITSGDLWFYSFNNHETGIPATDSGQQVIHCRTIPSNPTSDNAGFVVKRLKANGEQCHTDTNDFRCDSECDWFIKPRIRIDSIEQYTDKNVCKIIVLNQDRDTLKNVIIKANNFTDGITAYRGQYLEDFYNLPDSLKIHGAWGNWYTGARGSSTVDSTNKADIQVYWYGNCDMWIDYVRVDNDVASGLLSTDSNNTRHQDYLKWLRWEARDIACYGNKSPYRFYLELYEFNQIPCMAYVSRALDSLAYLSCGTHITLTALTSPIYSLHVPWHERFTVMNTGHFIRNFIEKIGSADVLIACYPFYTNKYYVSPYPSTSFSKIPNTLPDLGTGEVFAHPIQPSAYDTWLQDNLDHDPYYWEQGSTAGFPYDGYAHQWEGAFRWTMKMGDEISKTKNIPFFYNGQSHLWYYADGESHREPTNEEMEMLGKCISYLWCERSHVFFLWVVGWTRC